MDPKQKELAEMLTRIADRGNELSQLLEELTRIASRVEALRARVNELKAAQAVDQKALDEL